MKLIYFIARRSITILVWAVISGSISGICTSALLGVINLALNENQALSRNLIYLFVLLAAVVPVARITSEVLLNHLGQNALLNLRVEMSRLLLNQPLRRVEELGSHRILSVLLDDIPSITGLISSIPLLCINFAVVIACMAYLIWLSPTLFFIMLVFMVIGITTYFLPIRIAKSRFRAVREEYDNLQKQFNALVRGAKELKIHRERRTAFLDSVLARSAGKIRDNNVAGSNIYTVAASWGQLLAFVVIGLLILVNSNLGHGHHAITGFALCLLYMVGPLQMIMNVMPQMGRAKIAIEKIDNLGLDLKQSVEANHTSSPFKSDSRKGRIDFIDVIYRYFGEDGREFQLGPINLSFEPGEIVVLAGGNGSGKTTLAKVLCGLYVPLSGTIRFQGRELTPDLIDDYRQYFSVVFSDFHLFEALLGLCSEKVDERAKEYLSEMGLDLKVSITDGKFSTIDLSQGQRKRLALLVAYLEDRPIYLFDEWAADQDPRFKETFYRSLVPELKERGKTIFLVSHDDRFYDVGDRIITLESGMVTAETRQAIGLQAVSQLI
ncbi:MAG: ABC transporter ATP-binding protein [Blastocatellia bacterium AA13]|nr:MAG: ABC transporter ATP-binding protein [Blastocatellia bacterium AA13]